MSDKEISRINIIQSVLSLLHDHYSDFGPTLAAEKLRERHNITVSVETLRKWMTADGL